MRRVDVGDRRRDAGRTSQRAHIAGLIRCHHRGDDALGAGSGSTAGTVKKGLVLGRGIDVDDQGDVVDVDAASGDVGRDQHADFAAAEVGEVALASALRQVAVQFDCGDACGAQLLGELLGAVLGAHEEQRTVEARRQCTDDGGLVARRNCEYVVGHGVDRRHFRVDRVNDRVDEVLAHQTVDGLVERRREQQPLAADRSRIEDALDAGEEAEVGHVIGLVEHGDFDRVESAVSLADEVLEATRAGDDDVDSLSERRDLRALADAAVDSADSK